MEKLSLDEVETIIMPEAVKQHLFEYMERLLGANKDIMGYGIELCLTATDNVFVSFRGAEYSFGFRSSVYSKGIGDDKTKVVECKVGDLMSKLGYIKKISE